MIQYKLIQSSTNHEFDWEALEQAGLQCVSAAEPEERAVLHDGVEQVEDKRELSSTVSWEAWKTRKHMCAPL